MPWALQLSTIPNFIIRVMRAFQTSSNREETHEHSRACGTGQGAGWLLGQVLTVNDQAETVCIRYLDALGAPELVDTEAWISADEIIAIDTGAHIEGSTYAISNDDFA